MALPKTIIANEQTWEVWRQPAATENVYGTCDKVNCRIVIGTDGPEQVQWFTFWHELLHCLQAAYDLPDGKLTEEDVARHYGSALSAFLLRNCNISWKEHPD